MLEGVFRPWHGFIKLRATSGELPFLQTSAKKVSVFDSLGCQFGFYQMLCVIDSLAASFGSE